MSVSAVFQQFLVLSPSHIRRRPLRHLLSLFAISVGVALFVSMRITQNSVTHAFRSNLDELHAGVDATINCADGVPRAVLDQVEKIPRVIAAPVVQGAVVRMPERTTVMIVGVDPARDAKLRRYDVAATTKLDVRTLLAHPDSLIISQALADAHNWKLGSSVAFYGPFGDQLMSIGGIFSDRRVESLLGAKIAFMEIGAAQKLLHRGDKFDRIDLGLASNVDRTALRSAIPANCTFDDSSSADSTFEYLFAQFQTIVSCVTILACMIGLFIVYNTTSLGVVERTKQIGILRALGAKPGEIKWAFFLEAGGIGLLASVIGAALGKLLSGQVLMQAAKTMTLIVNLGQLQQSVPSDVWIVAPLIGIVAAVMGAFVPARSAAGLPPVLAMKPGAMNERLRQNTLLWLLISIPLIALCLYIVRHPRTDWRFTSAAVVVGLFGVALAGPQMVVWLVPFIRKCSHAISHVPTSLAMDNIVKFPSRTSLTVVAFGGALSLVVAMSSLVGAMQREIDEWMNSVFVFDLTVQTNDLSTHPYPVGTLPGDLLLQARADPRCSEAYGVRCERVPLDGEEVMLTAYDADVFATGRIARHITDDPIEENRRAAALKTGQVDISNNLARIHHLKPGDSLTLRTPKGPHTFTVNALRRDYTWFRGSVFMDLAIYRNLWNDAALSYVDIRIKPGVSVEDFRADLTQRWAHQYKAFIYSTESIKDNARRLTRDWFALANVQLILAVIVGGVGVANTLLVSVISQSRQIGLLRAIGATKQQIQSMLAIESCILGASGGVLGCIMGMAISVLMVVPMAVKSTGFELPVHVPYGPMIAAVIAGIIIALGASILPLRAVRRMDVVRAIGYE